LSPLPAVTPDKIRIAELRARIEAGRPAELIIGLGGSAEAETTAIYLARVFRSSGLKITRLARGLPAGLELEYVDQITLGQGRERTTPTFHYGETKVLRINISGAARDRGRMENNFTCLNMLA